MIQFDFDPLPKEAPPHDYYAREHIDRARKCLDLKKMFTVESIYSRYPIQLVTKVISLLSKYYDYVGLYNFHFVLESKIFVHATPPHPHFKKWRVCIPRVKTCLRPCFIPEYHDYINHAAYTYGSEGKGETSR